jgi:pentatricopeptide repeat domain-containing protein 1
VTREQRPPNLLQLYTMAISTCARAQRWEEALSLLAGIRARGLKPDNSAYTAAINACGQAGEWQRALQLLYDDVGAGLAPAFASCEPAVTLDARPDRSSRGI